VDVVAAACRAVVTACRHTLVESPTARFFLREVFLPPWAPLVAPWAHPLVPQEENASGPPPYHAPLAMNGGYGPTGGYGMPPIHPGMSPGAQDNVQPPYSNVVKGYANWNACYWCGFDVGNKHTSMSCPSHLRKVTHQVGFNCQNAQQYINLGYPCSTCMRHKTQFPTNM
jgi:hypothetical protein